MSRSLLGCVLLLGAGTHCAAPTPIQKTVAAPTLEMLTYEARVVNERLDSVTLEFPFEVESNTTGPVRVGMVKYTLKIEGEPQTVGAVSLTDAMSGPGQLRSRFTIRSPFPISREAFARRTQPLLPYTMDAVMEITSAAGLEEFEAQWSGEVFAPQRPTFTVMPQAARYDDSLELKVAVTLGNPNSFALPVTSLPIELLIGTTEVFSGEVARNAVLEPRSETKFEVPVQMDSVTREAIYDDLREVSGFDYHARSKLISGELTLSMSDKGRVEFSR